MYQPLDPEPTFDIFKVGDLIEAPHMIGTVVATNKHGYLCKVLSNTGKLDVKALGYPIIIRYGSNTHAKTKICTNECVLMLFK